MPNPYGYSEKWMDSQRDPRWKDFPLGHSNVTLGTHGCLVSCLAYIMSRWAGHDITPKDACAWFNEVGAFDKYGNFKWDYLRIWSEGGLVYQGTNAIGGHYSIQWLNNNGTKHATVLLRNPANGQTDIIYDPWQTKDFVQSLYLYSPRYETVWIRANVKPKT